MHIIGLMSGTSADGVDAALVEIRGHGRRTHIRLLGFRCLSYEPPLREAILRCCDAERARLPELCAVHALLSERFAAASAAVARDAGVALREVDALACHGQTVWHQPEPRDVAGASVRGTLQIGSAAALAARTGCAVVSDFRSADMAAGGHGAPLVAYADWLLLASADEARAVQNIGGIANVTYLPRDARRDGVVAFDTGPGSMVIDALVGMETGGARRRDEGGCIAASGRVHPGLLAELLNHPFFRQAPPRTTGREVFGEPFARALFARGTALGLSHPDVLATATALTAESIATAYREHLAPRGAPGTVIVGGGGVHNATLMAMLAERLAPARVTTHAAFGMNGDAKEAVAFALLAYETLHGRPSNVPSATGARHAAILGSVTPGTRRTRWLPGASGSGTTSP